MSSSPRMICPHCSSVAKLRTSRAFSPITREQYYICKNEMCGHAWKVMLTAVATIVPSRCPNPSIFIPMSKSSKEVPEPKPTG